MCKRVRCLVCCRVARVETARRVERGGRERGALRAHHATAQPAPRAARSAPLREPQVAGARPPPLAADHHRPPAPPAPPAPLCAQSPLDPSLPNDRLKMFPQH